MQTKIYIVEYCDSSGNSIEPTTRKIIQSTDIIHNSPRETGNFYAKTKVRFYDDWGDCHIEYQEVKILESFIVITKGEFIRNDRDDSKLNAYYMSNPGFGINHLAYSYSVNIIRYSSSSKLWDSDLYYNEGGIKSTQFDMYSYHVNDPEQEYIEDRLDYEVFDSLNFDDIFDEYLTISDKRNNKLNKIGLK